MILPGLASLPFGIGFGVAAAQKGLSAFETTLMSFTVMAGTSQMVALDIWAQPLPLMALAVSVFVANLRYFVMGAALQPHLPHLPWWLQPPVWYVTVDQNWAVNIAEYRRGQGDLGKFLGGGFVMAWIWSGSTLAGHLAAGGILSDPTMARRLGLDFVGVAVFVVVATILFRGKRDIAPWAVAIAAALAAMAAKGGGFIAMRWLGRHRFVNALLDHAPGAVLVSAAVVPLTQSGGAFIVGAVVGTVLTRTVGGFTAGLFGAVGAVALARWAGLA